MIEKSTQSVKNQQPEFCNNRINGKESLLIKVKDEEIKIIKTNPSLVIKVMKEGCTGYFKPCMKKGNKEVFDNLKNKLAYESLAKVFGLSEYIPHTDYCVLKTDKKELVGCFQVPSKGSEIWKIPSWLRVKMILPEFQRALSKMRLFDSLCHELDHSLNNYRPIISNNTEFISVSMFDNGGLGTFGRTSKIYCKTYYGLDPLFTDDNHFTIPHQDDELINKILNISFREVNSALSPYVSIDSILFTYLRIKKIRKAVKKDSRNGYLKLLTPDQWSQKTIDDELSGRYGRTYLFSLVHDWGGDGVSADDIQKIEGK